MKLTQLATGLLLAGLMTGSALAADKIVIAHRGASGYLPEHTLPAKAMAYAQGADYLEQDLVMTKDDQLVVLHDHDLDRVTDVADAQDEAYRESVLPSNVAARVAVEAGIADYWYKYVGLKGAIVGMRGYGESAPADKLFPYFGFTVENVVEKALSVI